MNGNGNENRKPRFKNRCYVCGKSGARFQLPTDKDEEKKLLWCRILDIIPPPDARHRSICDKHFRPADIILRDTRCSLKKNALPLPYSKSKLIEENVEVPFPTFKLPSSVEYKNKEEPMKSILAVMDSQCLEFLETSDVKMEL